MVMNIRSNRGLKNASSHDKRIIGSSTALQRWYDAPIKNNNPQRQHCRRPTIMTSRQSSTTTILLFTTILVQLLCSAIAFSTRTPSCLKNGVSSSAHHLTMATTVPTALNMLDDFSSDMEEVGDGDLDGGGVVIEDLMWRVEKLRLEEQNTKKFLKSRARFLPYQECRKWVQAWGSRWETAEDWEDWISMGEKKNPYVPSRPDEYYGRLGQWVSWEHFLLIPPEEDEDNDKKADEEGDFS